MRAPVPSPQATLPTKTPSTSNSAAPVAAAISMMSEPVASVQPSLAHGLSRGARRMLQLAVAALARREHGRMEIAQKLSRRLRPGEAESDLAQALDRLQERGLLSDRRLAETLVQTRKTRYGRRRLAQELDRRGVSADIIAATLPGKDEDAAHALALWKSKFGVVACSGKQRARQIRFLLGRGYSLNIVAEIVRTGPDDERSEHSN